MTADRKQLRKGSPLRLVVFKDKPKYPMLMAILMEGQRDTDLRKAVSSEEHGRNVSH